MTTDGVYVYATIRAGRPLPTDSSGVVSPAARLRVIRQRRVAAVVSDAPANLRARRRDLLAHQDLLLRLTGQGLVLPMRFGMVAPDEEAVRARLAACEADHLAVPEHLADRVKGNVKAFSAQNALRSLLEEDKNVRRLRDEARHRPGYEANVRLAEAVASAQENKAAAVGRQVLRELTSEARAVASVPEVHGCVLNVSFLVSRGDSDGFRSTVEQFAEAHRERVELRLAGRLPCYSFVSAESTSVRTVGV